MRSGSERTKWMNEENKLTIKPISVRSQEESDEPVRRVPVICGGKDNNHTP